MRKLAVSIAIAAALVVTTMVQGQGMPDPTLIKLRVDFAAAFNAKDAAKVASFYADDAVLMPPNQSIVKGRASIEADYKRAFEQGVTNLQVRPMEVVIAGTHAFEAGTTIVTVPGSQSSGAGSSITESGKYVVIYKKVGSDWKIAYDVWNSDQPPPPHK
jgi:uncharacterized protein (TIGR02246 family)